MRDDSSDLPRRIDPIHAFNQATLGVDLLGIACVAVPRVGEVQSPAGIDRDIVGRVETFASKRSASTRIVPFSSRRVTRRLPSGPPPSQQTSRS